MVVSLVLDVTLDLGYWVITRVGGGLISLTKYAFAESKPNSTETLAIEAPGLETAEALDAAAVLRVRGALDDETYVNIVHSLVTTSKAPSKDTAPLNTQHVEPVVPSAPPAYERLFDSKLNLNTS